MSARSECRTIDFENILLFSYLLAGSVFELSKRSRIPLYLTLRFINLIVELVFTGSILHLHLLSFAVKSLCGFVCMGHDFISVYLGD